MDDSSDNQNIKMMYRKDLVAICIAIIFFLVCSLVNFIAAHKKLQNQTATSALLTETKHIANEAAMLYNTGKHELDAQKINNRFTTLNANIKAFVNGDDKINVSQSPLSVRSNELAKIEKRSSAIQEALVELGKQLNLHNQNNERIEQLKTAATEMLPFYKKLSVNQQNTDMTELQTLMTQYALLEQLLAYYTKISNYQGDKRSYAELVQLLKANLTNESLALIKKHDQNNIVDAGWVNNAKILLNSKDIVFQQFDNQFEVNKQLSLLSQQNQLLNSEIIALIKAYHKTWQDSVIGTPLGMVFLGLAIILFAWLMYGLIQETKNSLLQKKHEHKANRASVWRLTDEIAHLADGDLTAHATIRDDITGAIAEAVNYTIDALRRLVSTINKTAVQVSSSAQDAQITARRLVEESEIQVRKIVHASAQIQAMAQSIEQVSLSANQSANVAGESVNIAKNGGKVVRDSIKGMESIKEKIQQTAKQIKRLGESSQEIGAILALIDDITEQTNILALNAAIQAAMAGDAGKGFAVVAEEVQRLAEKSNHATKQIEALVHTIQHDTQETVKCMEQTTSEVVEGSKLAHNAGIALENIETVSQDLAHLIEKISDEAKRQAHSALEVSQAMQVIKDMTNENASGTMNTAGSVGQLAELAVELRDSVAGFKLPMHEISSKVQHEQ